jgi:hypothetical protein
LNKHYDNLFAHQQFGFRADHRTTDCIFILKSLISKYSNKKTEKIYARFIDLRKAFDFLWCNGLRYKLIQNKLGWGELYNVISDMYDITKSSVKLDKRTIFFHTQ